VHKRALAVGVFAGVYMATDDDRIKEECEKLGMKVVMTSDAHSTGTDRMGEVAGKVGADLYVNLQGDEPLILPDMVESLIEPFEDDDDLQVGCLMTRIRRMADLNDSTVPKIVVNDENRAVYMSRFPVPYPKGEEAVYYKQVCAYGFRPKALEMFCSTERGPAERAEDIELLRFIENGVPVQMVEVERDTVAVDTPADLQRVREMLKEEADQGE
jgi:3-deoxy-manno-octulosonate cytidylyltransferase (CMP-KDO synthetase)